MRPIFTLGETLPDPKPRPYEIQARHRFSPKEEDFDRIKRHNRLNYSSSYEFRKIIDEFAWVDLVNSDPTNLRNFIKNHLLRSEFSWPWLDFSILEFDKRGNRPNSWKNRGIEEQKICPAEVAFRAWLNEIYVLTRAISDMRNFRSVLSFNPDALFMARIEWPEPSVFEQDLCDKRNATLMQAIRDDNLDLYLGAYPLEPCIVAMVTKRNQHTFKTPIKHV
ncbi:hypothetical protein [Gluconobacter sp.]|uniref:hypothetical protein n=1 Tax=Gluconobacter sp. TaxID=1876758 RepID=UPI0039E878BA